MLSVRRLISWWSASPVYNILPSSPAALSHTPLNYSTSHIPQQQSNNPYISTPLVWKSCNAVVHLAPPHRGRSDLRNRIIGKYKHICPDPKETAMKTKWKRQSDVVKVWRCESMTFGRRSVDLWRTKRADRYGN